MVAAATALKIDREPLLSNEAHFETAAPQKNFPKDKHPVNYPVPNFGQDKDVIATRKHWEAAEKGLNHFTWDPLKKPVEHPVNYKVNDFGLDSDIIATKNNLRDAEDKLEHKWNIN